MICISVVFWRIHRRFIWFGFGKYFSSSSQIIWFTKNLIVFNFTMTWHMDQVNLVTALWKSSTLQATIDLNSFNTKETRFQFSSAPTYLASSIIWIICFFCILIHRNSQQPAPQVSGVTWIRCIYYEHCHSLIPFFWMTDWQLSHESSGDGSTEPLPVHCPGHRWNIGLYSIPSSGIAKILWFSF